MDAWSSAGAALEPGFEPLTPWHATVADRRGIDALTGADPLTTTLVRQTEAAASNGQHRPYADQRPLPEPSSPGEDPYADELAQGSAEFARHGAFDEPTPTHGTPLLSERPPPVFTPYQPAQVSAAVAPPEVVPIPVMPPLPAGANPALTMPTGGYPVPPPGLRPSLPAELAGPVPEAPPADAPLAAMAEAATRSVSAAQEARVTVPLTRDRDEPAEPEQDADPRMTLGARFGMAFAEPPLPVRPTRQASPPEPGFAPPARPDATAQEFARPMDATHEFARPVLDGGPEIEGAAEAAGPADPARSRADHPEPPRADQADQARADQPGQSRAEEIERAQAERLQQARADHLERARAERLQQARAAADRADRARAAEPRAEYAGVAEFAQAATGQPGHDPARPGDRDDSRQVGFPGQPSFVSQPRPYIPPAPPVQPRIPQPAAPPPSTPPADAPGAGQAAADGDDQVSAEHLPQRVPSVPDVPPTIHPVVEPEPQIAATPQLDRIASHLRRSDDVVTDERPDGFDVDAVLRAVRGVAGVRDAALRTTATGAHHLRLDLAEGADPAAISRMVARMLQEQMGIDAAPAGPAVPRPAPASDTPTPTATLPAPRSGAGAAPPPGLTGLHPDPLADTLPREPRRRHPVSVPRRAPGELRDRVAALRSVNTEPELPAAASPPPLPTERDQGPRAIIEHVQTSTFGLDATVEVRLNTGDRQAVGVASGPAVDAYVLRLCAAATAVAIDDLLREGTTTGESGRCFVEQATIVPMGSCEVAVVVVLLVCGGWVEQLAGSALVAGDPRRAVVRATLSAVNRRLAALLP